MFYIHENRAIILGIKTGKPLETLAVFGLQSFRPHVLAEDEGFEPPQTESESGVLPLHKSSVSSTGIIITTLPKKSSTFFLFSKSFFGAVTVCPGVPAFMRFPREKAYFSELPGADSGKSPALPCFAAWSEYIPVPAGSEGASVPAPGFS